VTFSIVAKECYNLCDPVHGCYIEEFNILFVDILSRLFTMSSSNSPANQKLMVSSDMAGRLV